MRKRKVHLSLEDQRHIDNWRKFGRIRAKVGGWDPHVQATPAELAFHTRVLNDYDGYYHRYQRSIAKLNRKYHQLRKEEEIALGKRPVPYADMTPAQRHKHDAERRAQRRREYQRRQRRLERAQAAADEDR